MTQVEEILKSVLREHSYSTTKQRMSIFHKLIDHEPQSMHEIVKKSLPYADRASVYRTLALFEQLGIVQRINIGWKYKIELTDRFSEHHHHITCVNCGKIVAINANELEKFITSLTNQHKFHPMSHQLEIQGLCDACSRKIES